MEEPSKGTGVFGYLFKGIGNVVGGGLNFFGSITGGNLIFYAIIAVVIFVVLGLSYCSLHKPVVSVIEAPDITANIIGDVLNTANQAVVQDQNNQVKTDVQKAKVVKKQNLKISKIEKSNKTPQQKDKELAEAQYDSINELYTIYFNSSVRQT